MLNFFPCCTNVQKTFRNESAWRYLNGTGSILSKQADRHTLKLQYFIIIASTYFYRDDIDIEVDELLSEETDKFPSEESSDERVARRTKELGFKPQGELHLNFLLPYAELVWIFKNK